MNNTNDINDLLDICELTKLRDANKGSYIPESEKKANNAAIEYKLKNLINKTALSFSKNQMDDIQKNNKKRGNGKCLI